MKKTSGTVGAKLVIIFSLLLLFGLLTLFPFYYQTQTLWYKFGTDRTLLIAGQLAGLYAAFLVLLQLVLIVRLPILTSIFGSAPLIKLHRINGKLIPLLALTHALLILVPEGLGNLPLGWKFWPEIVGVFSFVILVLLSVSDWLRMKLQIPYARWKMMHRLLGLSVCIGIGVHIAFVSDVFEQVTPLNCLFLLIFGVLLVYAYGKILQMK